MLKKAFDNVENSEMKSESGFSFAMASQTLENSLGLSFDFCICCKVSWLLLSLRGGGLILSQKQFVGHTHIVGIFAAFFAKLDLQHFLKLALQFSL